MVAIAFLSRKFPYFAGMAHVFGRANRSVLYIIINGLRVSVRLCPGGMAVTAFQARDSHGPKSSGRALAYVLPRRLLDGECGDWICDVQ
jgi:hypothetical protein